jgi:hypothetical protein
MGCATRNVVTTQSNVMNPLTLVTPIAFDHLASATWANPHICSLLNASIYLINRNTDESGERAAIDSANGCVKLVGPGMRRAIVHAM